MQRQIALHTLIWTVVLSAASPVLAYVPSKAKDSRTKMHWMETNCVFMRINSAGSADVQDGSDITAATQSIEAWRGAVSPCSYLDFVLLDSSAEAKPGYDSKIENENVIFWQETKWPHEKAAAALTTVVYIDKKGHSQDGRILDADIELNGVNFTFSTTGKAKTTDIQNTVTHELGHLMGLDHTCRDPKQNPIPTDHTGATIPLCEPATALSPALKATTMFPYTGPGDLEKRSPEADDVQGICDTYPLSENPGACVPHLYTSESGCTISPSSTSAGGVLFPLLIVFFFSGTRRRGVSSSGRPLVMRPLLFLLFGGVSLLSMDSIAGKKQLRSLNFRGQVEKKSATIKQAMAFKVPRGLHFRGPSKATLTKGKLRITGQLINPTAHAISVFVFPVQGAYPLFMEFSRKSPIQAKPHPGPPVPPRPPGPREFSIPPRTQILFSHHLELEQYIYQGSPEVTLEWQFHYWNDPKPKGTLQFRLPTKTKP